MVQHKTDRVTASQHMCRHTEMKGCYFIFSSHFCAWLLKTHRLCTTFCIHASSPHFAGSVALCPFMATVTVLHIGSVGCLQDRGTLSSGFGYLHCE